MKHMRWYLSLTFALMAVSAAFYFIQDSIFHKTEDTFFYMLQDIAFVPVQVLLVTLFLNQLLTMREKRALLKKMNMLIGTFYIEVGTELMKQLFVFGSDLSPVREKMLVAGKWKERDFINAQTALKNIDYGIDSRRGDLEALRSFLNSRRDFLLSLLANPNLMEHDAFTDLLWAVFHLVEELCARKDFSTLPKSDLDHLSGDIKRAFTQLLIEWLAYMKHLKEDYPYLFSLAVRMNPMDSTADPVVK
jgi:hydrogenase-4 membrane subunit HyfE